MSETLSALDTTFLDLEENDPAAHMSIGGTLVFDPGPAESPSFADLRARVDDRLPRFPRYGQRLSSARTSRLSRPTWQHDEGWSIDDHLLHAALPAPGSDSQLCAWTAELFSSPLDRRQPLWQLALVDGLQGGRWAVGTKLHHCMVDGVGSTSLLGLLLDEREPRADPRPAARRAAAAGPSLVRVRGLLDLARDELGAAPHCSLNQPIGQARHYAIVRVPVADLAAVGAQAGGSVNDAVLAACAGGLRELLLARDEELPRRGLRAMVPVDMRHTGTARTGNHVSSLFIDLPVAEPVADVRLGRIIAATRQRKRDRSALGPSTLLKLADLLPPALLHLALAQAWPGNRLFNLTITNVRGHEQTVHAFGAPLREVHPVVPLASDHTVGIAVFSYDGLLTFGINADAHTTPDLEVLAQGIERGIEDLMRLLPQPPTVGGDQYCSLYE